jgi:hypothetical protein
MSTITILPTSTRWLMFTAIAVVLTGAVAGCSSGSDASPSTGAATGVATSAASWELPSGSSLAVPGGLTKHDLIGAADQTCHAYAMRVEISYDDLRSWRQALKNEQHDLRVTMHRLRKFRVAPAADDGWERFLKLATVEQQARSAFVHARLSGGTPQQQRTTAGELYIATSHANQVAARYGLRDCAVTVATEHTRYNARYYDIALNRVCYRATAAFDQLPTRDLQAYVSQGEPVFEQLARDANAQPTPRQWHRSIHQWLASFHTVWTTLKAKAIAVANHDQAPLSKLNQQLRDAKRNLGHSAQSLGPGIDCHVVS